MSNNFNFGCPIITSPANAKYKLENLYKEWEAALS